MNEKSFGYGFLKYPNTRKKIAANVTPKKKLEANCINLTPNRLKCASINENQDSLKSDPLASPLRRSLKITSSPPKTEPTITNSIPTIKILRGTPKKKLTIESDDEDTKPKCQTLPKVPDLNAVEKCTNFLSLKATKAFVVVCTLGRVSVLGVESLWGDCRFIPADWGSQQ